MITYNKLGYVSLVGWIVRFHPLFTEFLEKKQKTGTKIESDVLGYIPLTGWILRFYPVFPEFTQKTENRGENWLWKAMMYLICL